MSEWGTTTRVRSVITLANGEVYPGYIHVTDWAHYRAGPETPVEMLNRTACEAMLAVGVHACTDITGFGLLGHTLELAEASGVMVEIDAAALPAYPHSREMAAMGLIPVGSYNNRDHYLPKVLDAHNLAPEVLDLLADPQTSGGLLIAVAAERLDAMLRTLTERGAKGWVVGRVKEGPSGQLRIV